MGCRSSTCRNCESIVSKVYRAIDKEEERKTKIAKIVARSTGGGKEKLKQVVQLVMTAPKLTFDGNWLNIPYGYVEKEMKQFTNTVREKDVKKHN